MTTREHLQHTAAIVCGLLAIGAALLGISVTYGLASEYAGGTGLSLLPVAMVMSGLFAALAARSWSGLSKRFRVGVPLAVVVAVGLGGLAGDQLGARAHQQRLVSGSESFACNGPNAEIEIDERVDATFAELPRRAPIYGPVEGSQLGCTAAVYGDGAETFTEYANAFRGLAGWTVTTDGPSEFVMQRDGVLVEMRTEGAPDQLTVIEVRTLEQDA